MAQKSIHIQEKITVHDSWSARVESEHLIISNKKRCADIISGSDLSQNDIIDVFISLHIVLEVSINTLFRHLTLLNLLKEIDKFELIKNLDNISFRDKVVMFIYNSKFIVVSSDELSKLNEYHSIIGKIKEFSGLRNQLLHGHSISAVFDGEGNRHTNLNEELSLEGLEKQIKRFRFIVEGLRFYLDRLDSSLTESGRESYTKVYLNDDFLPNFSLGES